MQTEEWRPIPGLSDDRYEVSNLGRIRSRKRGGSILKVQGLDKGMCPTVVVFDGKATGISVGRAVCEAFNGPPPVEGWYARHRDGNQLNNTPENLVWANPGRRPNDF